MYTISTTLINKLIHTYEIHSYKYNKYPYFVFTTIISLHTWPILRQLTTIETAAIFIVSNSKTKSLFCCANIVDVILQVLTKNLRKK